MPPSGRWRPAIPAGAGAVLIGVAATVLTWNRRPYPGWVWLPTHLAGISFAVAGVALWLRRPANATGRMMVAVAVAWYIGDLQLSGNPAAFAVGFCLFYTSSTILTHLVLALPTGRLTGRVERVTVVVQYLLAPATQIPRYLDEHPPRPQFWGDAQVTHSVWANLGSIVNLIVVVTVLVLVLRRWSVLGRPARREYGPAWLVAISLAVVSALLSLGFLTHANATPYLLLVFSLGLVLTPQAIAAGLLRVRLARARIADLVLRLTSAPEPATIQDAVAAALDDPNAQVCLLAPAGGYLDLTGQPLPTPLPAGRAVTPAGEADGRLLVLVHDAELAPQRPFVDAVAAAVRLSLDNARLRAAHQREIRAAAAARASLVHALDDERRRIQRDLHDGTQHNLLAASILVEQARRELVTAPDGEPASGLRLLTGASDRLRDALRELRMIAAGIHPPILDQGGLPAALEMLAERAPVPVVVDATDRHWPAELERVAYYVVTEALANAYKHAGATLIEVRVDGDDTHLAVEVVDDGAGGAAARPGGGLAGLRERAGALGGRLELDSTPGRGTRLRVELPCG
jgi:signal transduction histidine kinase